MSCGEINQVTRPVFLEFNTNLTATLEKCKDDRKEFQDNNPMLDENDLNKGLQNISLRCSDMFIGFLVEVVQRIEEVIVTNSDELLNIITGGIRDNTNPLLKCIASDLETVFINITVADEELGTKVNLDIIS